MTSQERYQEQAKKMTLLNTEDGNWNLKFRFENGKAIIYYIAKDPTQCHSGYFGDIAHIKRLMRTKMVDGDPMFDASTLTFEGRLLVEANGIQELYEKLLKQSFSNAV